ncbi:hypothetical protein [Pseudonocardia zijingensis]
MDFSNPATWPIDPGYRRLLTDAATGRCPVWVYGDRTDPPVVPAATVAELDTRGALDVLSENWPGGGCACCNERLDPFRDGFPGLLERPPVDPEEAVAHAARAVAGTPNPGVPISSTPAARLTCRRSSGAWARGRTTSA